MKMSKIKQGDKIKFKSLCRWGAYTVVRTVKEVNPHWIGGGDGCTVIRYGGCPEFFVKRSEIIEVIK